MNPNSHTRATNHKQSLRGELNDSCPLVENEHPEPEILPLEDQCPPDKKTKHIDEVWTVDTKIENMGLSARLENGLAKLGLYTIDQILKQGYKKLVDLPYLGEVSVNELNAKLHEKGIKLHKYPLV